MKFSARIVVFFSGILLLCSSLFYFSSQAFAQETPQQYTGPAVESNVPHNSHTLSQGLFFDIFSAISCQLTGIDPLTQNHECLGYNPTTGKLTYAKNDQGAMGFFTSTMAIFYNPPVHTGYYLSYLGQNFGLTKHAYAANTNTGFDQLSPLTNLWIAFRNLVYLFYVLAFVVIGMAIMLRVKMDPRTVMTIENQIPKIIISLILVTFSFAIAGLLVDLMWVVMYLVINIFASIDPSIHAGSVTGALRDFPFTFVGSFRDGGVLGIAKDVGDSVAGIVNNTILNIFNTPGKLGGGIRLFLKFPFFITAGLPCLPSLIPIPTRESFGQCMDGNIVSQISLIGGVIAFLIAAFAVFLSLLKIWMTLLYAYVLFLMFAATGPLFIIAGIVPGSKVNFEYWIKQMLAYLSSFVVTLAILLFGKVLMDSFGNSTAGFVPPFMGASAVNASQTMAGLIGFAVILLTPQALQMSRDLIGAPPIKYLPGIGQGLAAGTQNAVGTLTKPAKLFFREANFASGRRAGLGTELLHGIRTPFGGKTIGELMGYTSRGDPKHQ